MLIDEVQSEENKKNEGEKFNNIEESNGLAQKYHEM